MSITAQLEISIVAPVGPEPANFSGEVSSTEFGFAVCCHSKVSPCPVKIIDKLTSISTVTRISPPAAQGTRPELLSVPHPGGLDTHGAGEEEVHQLQQLHSHMTILLDKLLVTALISVITEE